jgi:cytochrome c oxidase cbb3-type subunit I/II
MAQRVTLTTIVLNLALGLAFSRGLGHMPAAWGQEQTVEGRLQHLTQQITQHRGRRLYRQACAPCHGVRGDGQGPAARALEPKPHDFTTGLYKFRTTPFNAMPTDADLLRTISEGIPGTAMPAWKRLLSEQQRLALVQYIKTFAADKFAGAPTAQPVDIPAAPPTTPAHIARGKQIYDRLQCWQCHGRSGRGDGPIAAALPIPPQNLTRGVYKSGQQPEDLLRTVLTGLAGTPMAPYAEVLSLEEGWDLVHYVRSLAYPKTFWYDLFVDTGEFFPGH